MSTALPPAASAPRFFRDYNRVISVAYALILFGLLLFFSLQLRQRYNEELAVIETQVARHGEFLEFVLRSSTDQLESLRMIAGSDTRSARRCMQGGNARAFPDLREVAGGFNRDAIQDKDLGGNLVGLGRLVGRHGDFYCDIAAAMGLNGSLQGMTFSLPSVARARFISAHGFHLVSPWRPSADLPFNSASLSDPVWRLGTPDADPDRSRYWIPPYFAGEQAGLLAPVAAPVYDGQRFMGVIVLDFSLDYLNRINSDFAYPLGSVAVIDAGGRVLAHPQLYRDPLIVREPPTIQQLLATEVSAATKTTIDALAEGRVESVGDALLLRQRFVSAPWQLLYSVPRYTLWLKLLKEHGASMAAVFAGLALLMAVTYVLTSRLFVGPAAKLVDHLVAESVEQPRPVPAVPSTWRPWFEAITKAFRQSLQLSSLRREVDIAARLQQSILPRRWPSDPRFQLWGTMLPAKDVGGDFYDHFVVGDGLRGIVVADVSGKGISAGLFGMVSKTHLRAVATRTSVGPGAMVTLANKALCADGENENCMFLTLLYAQYDPASGIAVCVNAGHPSPLLVHADGRIRWLPTSTCPMMGIMDDIDYEESVVQLVPGDTLLLFTDGVTEAMNAQREEFSEPRLASLFDGQPTTSPEETIQRVLDAVSAFAQAEEQFDDITCVALRCVALDQTASLAAAGETTGGGHAI
ncbi:MAG: SpoIIE family protein phosphatase [Pseudomonadota bacterium]